jgi:ADP-ribose pyrophosphatase
VSRWFFYGTLCHQPLLDAVLNRRVELRPAELQGWRAALAEGETFPILVPDHHGRVAGLLAEDLTEADEENLAFYEESFGYDRHELTVLGKKAWLYLPRTGHWRPGKPWSLADWVAEQGPRATEAARDYIAACRDMSPDVAVRNYPMMLQRATSRLRAQADSFPTRVKTAGLNVTINHLATPWLGFFGVSEADLSFSRFDGTMSPPVHRAGFLMGDAVTVLPYDPVRDRVMVIEQFRFGPYLRSDPNPWTLEPIAGRIDPGESPEEAARREAVEEGNLTIKDLHLVARYYPTPGAVSEYLYSYIALADLPDEAAGLGGKPDEHEDIRGHLLSFDALMALIETPEAGNGPLILTALALARRRDTLRRTT